MKIKEGIKIIKSKFFQSDFIRNVLTLMTGTALAQLIPLMIAPVLSRIYSPAEFGRLALYMSIVQILGAVANGRYELAIVLPKERMEGVQLTLVSIMITIGVSLFSLLGILFFSEQISQLLGDPKLSSWLFMVPISVLMIGLFNALNYYNIREKKFKDIAKANVFKSSGGSIFQLFLGFAKYTAGGLIVGQVMSHFFGNIRLMKHFLKEKDTIKQTQWMDLKSLANRYIDFPKFSLWGIFFNTLSVNLSNLFISWFYTLSSVGYYSHAYRYLGLPVALMSKSIGQVYFQKLSVAKLDKDVAVKVFFSTLKKLTIASLAIFVPLFFIIEELFSLLFGEEWRIAGNYASYLIPLFFIRFIFAPLSLSNVVFEKQKIALYCQILIIAANLCVLFLTYFLNFDIKEMIIYQVVIMFLVYFSLFFILIKVVKGKL